MREQVEGITFGNFAAVAKRMRWTADDLALEFRGIAEKEPAASYFSRVLRGDPAWSVVIPFRSVIAKYLRAVAELKADGQIRLCGCGCGSPVFGRDRLAWPDCKFKPTHGQNGREAGVPIP
jgi:hypothetical protein